MLWHVNNQTKILTIEREASLVSMYVKFQKKTKYEL